MNIRKLLSKNRLLHSVYDLLKLFCDNRKYKRKFAAKYDFDDRRKGAKALCILLAGYKPFLYPVTLPRIKRFAPDEIDFCVAASGVYSEELRSKCEEYGWSYLSTRINNVSLIQNIAVSLHPEAEYIYKLDEDIFVTEHCFQTLMDTHKRLEEQGEFHLLFVAPSIPVNGYSYMRVLENLGLTDVYQSKFGKPRYETGPHCLIENSGETAEFFWGGGRPCPSYRRHRPVFT